MTHHQLEFQVVGPLSVWRGGTAVPLPRSQVIRGLLGVLILADGEPLPADRLALAVWTHHPEAVSKAAVQVGVSRLRSWLRRCGNADGAVAVEHRGDGYRLDRPADAVDLDRFRALLADAETSTDPARRYDLLRSAMRLRRGPVLADVTTVNPAEPLLRVATEVLRAGVVAFGTAALATGRPGAAVTHLEALAEASPFDEPVHACLIEVLAAADQPAAALMRFERLRSRLADELGVAPSEAVQRAYLAVLARDRQVAVAGAAEPATARAAAPPAQLPIAAAGFAGRDAELARLDALLPVAGDGTTVAVTIDGTAGVGKTTLAVQWAHRVRSRFPDGQLYANLRGYAAVPPARPVDVLAWFLQALGEPAERVPAETDEAAALFRTRLADKRVLVLLDDARSAAQVRPLLPASAASMVLITSRSVLGGLVAREGAHRLSLGVLTATEAYRLLAETLGDARVRAEPQATAELAEACAHLPLALRIAGANIDAHPAGGIAGYVEHLRDGDRLAALQVDGDEHSAVRAAFSRSFAALPSAGRRMFRRLGLVPGPDVTAAAAAALGAVSLDEAGRLLDLLAGAALVSRHRPGRYACHDLLRLYAAERVREESDADRDAAQRRYFQWCLNGVDQAARRLYPNVFRLPWPEPDCRAPTPGPFPDRDAALAWLDAERPNLVAAVQFTAEHGPRPVAWLLADALRRYFWFREAPVDRRTVAEAGLAAAEAEGDARARAAGHVGLAEWHRVRSQYRPAIDHLTRAANLCSSSGWPEGEATALGARASVYWTTGQLEPAAESARAAIELCRRVGSRDGQSGNLGRLGMVHFAMGRLADAVECQHEALALNRASGNRVNAAYALCNLGMAYHALGRFDEALGVLDEALGLHREFGDRFGQSEAYNALAALHRDRGEFGDSVDRATAALEIAVDIGERRIEADARNRLADVARRRGQNLDALDQHRRARDLADAAGASCAHIAALIGLAWDHQRLGEVGDATTYSERAHASAHNGGYRLLEGLALTARAGAYRAQHRSADAVAHARQALELHRTTGYRVGADEARRMLADAGGGSSRPGAGREALA